MRAVLLRSVVGCVLCLVAFAGQKKKNGDPKLEVVPLPPEPPMALAADTQSLDFHISPLLRAGGLSAQIRQSLNALLRDTRGETVVKLRAFVSGTGDARQVQAEVVSIFSERKLPLPVLSILQVGALGEPAAQVVIEAVVSTGRAVNVNGLAFFFGQSGDSSEEAIERLKASVIKVGIPEDHLLTATCFASDIADFAASIAKLRELFPKGEVNVVQAVRDPADESAMCEGVGQLTAASEATLANGAIDRMPQAGTTLVRSPHLVFTGLQLSFGSYLNDAHEAFERLQKTAEALNPNETPVEVNGYSLDRFAASALKRTNSLAPGIFTMQTIEGLSAMDATGAIEAILAPGAKAAQNREPRP